MSSSITSLFLIVWGRNCIISELKNLSDEVAEKEIISTKVGK